MVSSFFLPIFSASSIVSGSFVPKVSGSSIDRTPAAKAKAPNTKSGKIEEILFSKGTNGAKSAPNLENVEKVPTPPLRMRVGSISAGVGRYDSDFSF